MNIVTLRNVHKVYLVEDFGRKRVLSAKGRIRLLIKLIRMGLPSLRREVERSSDQEGYGVVSGATVLKDISLKFKYGSFVGILGEEESGKSTLLKMIARLEPLSAGVISHYGRVAYISPKSVWFDVRSSLIQNIEVDIDLLGLEIKNVGEFANKMIEDLQMDISPYDPVRSLKKKELIALAQLKALRVTAPVMLYDEFFKLRGDFMTRLIYREIVAARKRGVTIIMASRSDRLVRLFADRVIWLKDAMVYRDGAPYEVIGEYRDSLKEDDDSPDDNDEWDVDENEENQRQEESGI